jgi:hypothetical protein
VPAILGDGDGFAIVRHLSAHGLGRRCHFRYGADDKNFQSRRPEQPTHLRVKGLEVERHKDVGLAVVDLVLKNPFRIQRRVVYNRATRFHHAEECDDVMRCVGKIESDMHARAHAELLESLSCSIS